MEKITFKTIESVSDTALYLDKVENYTGVRLPLLYANNSKIVGVFLHDKLVAGYMLVTNPNFRSLRFVPDSIKQKESFFLKDQYEMMEVNGLWIGPTLKKPSLQMKVWINMVKDIFLCRKKYVLLMRDIRNKNMERFMSMANPTHLYEGSPLLMAGENTHNEIQVSYATRWNIVLNAHKYWLELRNRQRRAEQFEKQRDYARALKQSEAEFV